MANRYWNKQNASPNWDATAPTNWGSASNTADNASVPGTNDDVFFDGVGGGANNSTISANITIKSLDCTGYTNTLTHNTAVTLTVSGGGVVFKLVSGMTYTLGSATTSALSFTGTSGTTTIDSGGKTFGNTTFNGVGGTWQLTGNNMLLGTTTTMTLTNGTFDANGKNVSIGLFSSNNANTRTLTMGTGTWTLTGSGTKVIDCQALTGFSLNRGNPFVLNYSGGTGTRSVDYGSNGDGSETVAIDVDVTAGTDHFAGDFAYIRNLNFTGFSGTLDNGGDYRIYGNVTFSSGMTITGGANAWNFNATSGTKTITSNGKTIDFPIVFDGVGGTWQLGDATTVGTTRRVTLTNGTFKLNGNNASFGAWTSDNANTRTLDISSGTLSITGNFDNANNYTWQMNDCTNFTFSRGNPVLFTYSGSNTRAVLHNRTGGGPDENQAIDASITAGTGAFEFTAGGNSVRHFNTTGFSGTLNTDTGAEGTFFIWGNLTISSTTVLPAGTGVWTFASTTGSRTLTSGGVTFDFPITFDGGANNTQGLSYQLQDSLTVGATRTVILTNGIFDANNNNFSLGIWSSSNTNTRSILMGSGTWDLKRTTTSTVWLMTTSTNATITPGSSTIKISGSTTNTRTFAGGGKTYNNIWFSNATNAGRLNFTGSNTFIDIKAGAEGNAQTLGFTAGTTTTFTTWNVRGALSNLITIASITVAGHTLTKAGGGFICADFLSISRSTFSPSSPVAGYAGANSTNGGNNSGWSFTNCPSGNFLCFFNQ